MSEEQPRESGRFAPKARPPEPPRERTATEILAEANSRSDFLIPPPLPMSEFNKITAFHGLLGEENTARWVSNTRRLRLLKAWFKAIAEHPEGFSHDLWMAWRAWDPILSTVRWANRTWFDELDKVCMRKLQALSERREEERRALMVAENKRRAIEAARAEIEEVEQQLEVEVPAELHRRRARLAELEAAI